MINKVVIITGASSGIGLALAKHYDSKGYYTVLAARSLDKLATLATQLRHPALAVAADVGKEDDCKLIIDRAMEAFGRIDVLICNAGASMRAMFDNVEMHVLHTLMHTNFWGTVYCCKYALPHLQATHGSIVGVSSIAGKVGLPARTGYSASKFAMEGFLESLRIENLHRHVHVLVACPGYTASNIRNTALNASGAAQQESPLDEKKLMTPEMVAQHIYKAVEKRQRDLVLTTNGKLIVWLKKWWPSKADAMIYKFVAKEKDSPFK